MLIHFDVDGTLITFQEQPRDEIISMLKAVHRKNAVNVWSRGGKEYAEEWGVRLGLPQDVGYYDKSDPKAPKPDVNVDDEELDLAPVTIRV